MNETRRQLAIQLNPRTSFISGDGDALANALLFERRLTKAMDLPARPQRRRIWELASSLHCSIVGTCLSTAELRQLLVKLDLHGAAKASDHDLHGQGVSLASDRGNNGRLLHKTLDRRHQIIINRFDKAETETAVRELWADALARGDIPGAYWATLTHPAATQALIRSAFGDIHMLSHLVGAANRADIHRLCQLEAEKTALTEKVIRQQERLREVSLERDKTVRGLNQLLVDRVSQQHADASTDSDRAALEKVIADLNARLSLESERRSRAEARQKILQDDLSRSEAMRHATEDAARLLQAEVAAAERALAGGAGVETTLNLSSKTILYVGGRNHLLPALKSVTERASGVLLHHDGGMEASVALLPGLIARADLVLFPVDCISHDAALAVKRLCRQAEKRFVPLRSAGLTSYVAALGGLSAG